jgi:dienelactone hydrolase
MNRRSFARACLALAVPGGLALALGMRAADPVREETGSFESGGKTIKVERYEPADKGKHPAVLVLYGAGGMKVGGVVFRATARELARRGYVAVLVHYFDRTGTDFGDAKTNVKEFATWLKTIGDAVTYTLELENVDKEHVGLLGFSLGAFLSLSEAVHDPRIGAVVEFFGGLPPALTDRIDKLPPTLILHGEEDRVVSVDEARKLEKLCKVNNRTYDIHIYPKSGHGFLGADGADAAKRTYEFFDKYLKP